MAFIREARGNRVIGIFNLTAAKQQSEMTNELAFGDYTDYFTGTKYTLNHTALELKP